MWLSAAAPAFPSLHAGDSAPEQTAAEWLTSHSNALGCDAGCHAMAGTELPGDVVLWGENHLQPSAADCCAACRSENSKRCNTWVWCADAAACGARHHQCWLKTRERPWEDADVLAGGSTMFAGLPERLEAELQLRTPGAKRPKIAARPERKHAAWVGASMLGSLSVMSQMWVSKEEYDETGPLIVNRKCF